MFASPITSCPEARVLDTNFYRHPNSDNLANSIDMRNDSVQHNSKYFRRTVLGQVPAGAPTPRTRTWRVNFRGNAESSLYHLHMSTGFGRVGA